MKSNYFPGAGVLLLIGLHAQFQPVAAGPITFTIDPTRSSISLSGTLVVPGVGSYAFQPQSAGSLTTSYSGSILADLSPPSIQFPGGSVILAKTNGIWQPSSGGLRGSGPADYGVSITPPFTTVLSATRNIRLDLTSSPALLTNGGLITGPLVVTYLTNSTPAPGTDFSVAAPLIPQYDTNGTAPLTGSGTNTSGTAYLTNSAGMLTLVLPVNTTNTSTLGSNQTTLILQGQLVATAPASAWPFLVGVSLQAGVVTLSWPSLPGLVFSVQTTQALGTSWGSAAGTMATNANTTTWTANTTGGNRFYRVVGSF